MIGASRASTLVARVIALAIGAQIILHAAAAQSDWKRIAPVERGRAMNVDIPPVSSRAIRLIFEYDADRVRIVQQTPVDIAPSSLPVTKGEGVGVFVDVRDVDNRTLARVPAPHALSPSLEIFPERHDQPITRTDAPGATGAFTVVVPMMAGADHVTIVRLTTSSTGDRSAPLRTTDLVSFSLKTR